MYRKILTKPKKGGYTKKRSLGRLNGRRESPDMITKHHRRPWGDPYRNYQTEIVRVRLDEHVAWNMLFEKLQPHQIPYHFWQYYRQFTQDRIQLIQSGRSLKKMMAWDLLFKGMSLFEIAHRINSTWCHPRHLIVIKSNPRAVNRIRRNKKRMERRRRKFAK